MPSPPTKNDVFSYGEVTLSFVYTKSLEEEPVYDPSGVDLVTTRVRLTVAGVVAPNVAPLTTGQKPADLLGVLDHYLSLPRQRLRYRLGGKTVFSVDPPEAANEFTPADAQIGAGQYRDTNNGPIPKGYSAVLVTEGGVGLEFTVEFHVVTCKGGGAARRGYASNRYEQTEEYDEVGYRTLRTSGLMIGRSDIPGNLDQFRGKIVPAVPNGYQRTASVWTLSPDGLRLKYELTDREYYLGPPDPAKKAGGKLVVASSNAGATYTGHLSLWLEAGKDVEKRVLMSQAVSILTGLLSRFMVRGENQRSPLAQLSFGTDIWNNRVEVSGRVLLDAKKIQLPGFGNVSLDIFVQDVPGSPKQDQPPIAPPVRGFFPLMELIAAEYQDPCVIQGLLAAGADSPTLQSVQKPPAGTNIALVNEGPVSPPPPAAAVEVPYDSYMITMRYDTDSGKRLLRNTAPGALHPVVQLYQATLSLTVSWTAERTGQTPSIPDPCPPKETQVKDPLLNNKLVDNFVLATQTVQPEQIVKVAGGAYKHTISGCYVYWVRSPCVVPLVEPMPPFLVKEATAAPESSAGSPANVTVNGANIPNVFATPAGVSPPPWLGAGQNPGSGTTLPGQNGLPLNPTNNLADFIAQIKKQAGEKASPAIPQPAAPGRQPGFPLDPDLIWYRMKTVKPVNELLCANCDGPRAGVQGELSGSPSVTGVPGQPNPS